MHRTQPFHSLCLKIISTKQDIMKEPFLLFVAAAFYCLHWFTLKGVDLDWKTNILKINYIRIAFMDAE